ncbi:PepSY domain-containing protein [Caulobacter sp. RHG1]|uniref:PepSY-associated TM helix domain-containing protein n=1 Tax=Caulobacter sp. (strain RHG1) TaxID=2545762 RepID=UPI00155210F6|nr:PepSY domain-containing protein [Caulobacter sp. RHG1]NQE61309.1 hypothetical protein [Caulobacter sp. RHG1]
MAPLRSLLRQFHLWLGLILGLPFLVLAFTGSALVFYIEIDALLNPAVRSTSAAPPPDWRSPAWDKALQTAKARWPEASGKWSFEVTEKPGAIPARYYPPSTAHGHAHGVDPLMVWFSPDGEQVVRQARWGDYLMTWFYDVHRNLLAGDTGNYVVGWIGVATLLLLITGLIVWWPKGSWRKALAYKRRASPSRRLYDLHKLLGLSSLVLLLILSATGALLALPAEKTWLLGKLIAPMTPIPSPVSTRHTGTQVSVGQALATAHAALPDAQLTWIDVPGPGDGAFRTRVRAPGDPTQRFPHSFVFVDQYSGKVLAVHDMRRGSSSTLVNAWIRPLHDASVGGLTTRILGVLVGFVPTMLFVTGFLRWRLRKTKTRSAG